MSAFSSLPRQVEGGMRMSWGHFFLCPTCGVTYSSAEPLSLQNVVLSGHFMCSMTYCIAQAPSLTPSGRLEGPFSARLGSYNLCLLKDILLFQCFYHYISV